MAKKKVPQGSYSLMKDSFEAYKEFLKRLSILHKKNPNLLKTTLANVFSMRYIGNKTHGDMAEIGLTEFINKFLYDYRSEHVGKDKFRSKENEEDIVILPLVDNEDKLFIPVSLKAYGEGPLQLSTDKVANYNDGLYKQIEKICKNGIITELDDIKKVFDLSGFKTMTNVLPLIYREKKNSGGECNIMIFDLKKAIKETKYIFHIKTGQRFDEVNKKVIKEKINKKKQRVYPIYLFLNQEYKYICEVRYGGKDANALQRGIWSDTKKGIDYFNIFEEEWIKYDKQEQLLSLIMHALNCTSDSHKKADKILEDDIQERVLSMQKDE